MKSVNITKENGCVLNINVDKDGKDFVLEVKGQSEHGKVDLGFYWRDAFEEEEGYLWDSGLLMREGEDTDENLVWDLGNFFRKHTKYSFFSLLELSNKDVVMAEESEEEVYAGMSSCCFESSLKKENGNIVYKVEMTSVGSYGSAKFEFGAVDKEKLKVIRKIVVRFENDLLFLAFAVKKHFIATSELEDEE